MLQHACGFALANKGHDTRALQAYLGHKNIQHTVRYTELSPETSGADVRRLAMVAALRVERRRGPSQGAGAPGPP
jgi:site-specific recombinase XerD